MASNGRFSEFYRVEFGRVVRSVRSLAGAAAEDIAQEAMLVAERRWSEVSTLDVPFAWVRRVAIRMAMRQAQREQKRFVLEAAAVTADPSDGHDLDVVAAIAELPDKHAAAVWLRYMEDQRVAVVADRLGCTEGAAKVLLLRARRRLAERLSGLAGRWVSERTWSPDAIATHVEAVSAAEYVGPVLEEDLRGRGGRWELTIADGSYQLHRDDGMRLDLGSINVRGRQLELIPALAPGHVLFLAEVDGNRLRLHQTENTTPPTRGVPDWVWMSLFLDSGPFEFAGRPHRSV